MARATESTDRAVLLLNVYGVLGVGGAIIAGFLAPQASYVVGPLLIVLPCLVLWLGMRSVAPEHHPSRDDQVMWLVGVTFFSACLLTGASSTIAPNLSVSWMDRFVFGLGTSISVWILLGTIRYLHDRGGVGKRSFLKPWHCRECGYDLRGSVSEHCPECATPVHCRTCGETFNPGPDGSCFRCGAKRVADPHHFDADDLDED